jgi:DNA-binding NarL/FixJ family response regulator
MAPAPQLQNSRSKVLIVEDEALIAESLSCSLSSLGYEVTGIADSCEQTLAEIANMKPDCILMDIRIRGEIDGIETTAKIRERLDIPVIYLTCQTDPSTIDRAKMTMASGFLMKSAHNLMLAASIEMAVHKHKAEHRRREGKVELERERSKEALRRSEQHLRALVEGNKGCSLLTVDEQGNVSSWAANDEKTDGYKAEEDFGEILLPLIYA